MSENFGTLLPYAEAVGAAELGAAHRFAVAFLHARHEQIEDRSTRASCATATATCGRTT